MITEDYISFETAKLLKEKGFDLECRAFYVKSKECGIELFYSKEPYNYNNNVYPCTSAPTLQMVRKWLREVHNIIPVILIGGYNKVPFYYWFRIDKINDGEWEDSVYRNEVERNTYEEACEAAIKYCLENLI